jgi:outer membrane protein assembly complex protein YaeT
MKRNTRKKLWLASSCALFLIVLGILILHSPFVKKKILVSLQTNLREGQGIQISVQSFDYNLLRLRFTLRGIQIQKSGKSGQPPVFRAKEIIANIPLSLLLRRKLRIQEIAIIDPEICIQIDRNGNTNLPRQKRPEKSPQAQTVIPDFLIEHIEIKNTKISIIDRRNDLELELPEIWINGEGQDFGRHSFRLEMRGAGSAGFRGRSFPLEKWNIEAELNEGGVNIKKLFLAAANNEIEFMGRIGDFSSLFINGSIQGYFDVEDFRSSDAADTPFFGEIRFQSHLKGPLKELEARVDMQSQGLQLGKIENIGMKADLSWKNRTLEILSLDLSKENGAIHGQGILFPLDWEKGNHLELKWEALDVAPFMDLLRSPYLFSARTDGELKVSWDGFSRDDINGECDIRLTPVGYSDIADKGIPLGGRIAGRLDSGRLDISSLDISALDAVLGGRLILHSDRLSGEFKLETKSIGRMMPLIVPFAGEREKMDLLGLGLDGPASASVTLGGALVEPEVRLSFKSTDFRILKTTGLRVGGTAFYDRRSLHFETLSIEDGEARIRASGIYPLQPSGQSMRFDVEGEDLSVERIKEIFGSGPKATGSIQFQATVEGTTDDPRVEAKWSVSNASLYEVNLGLIEGKGDYRNGKFILDSFHVTGSTGVMDATGSYDPGRDEFKLKLSGKSFPLRGLKIIEDLAELKAELDIDLEASGTPGDPHIETRGMIRRFSLGARTLPDLGFEARTLKGNLLFEVEAPIYSGVIDGTVSLRSPHVLHADLTVSQMPIEDVADNILLLAKHNVSGTVTAGAHIELDLGDPLKSLICGAKIDQAQIRSGDHLLQNDGPILLSYGSESLHVERLLLTGTRIRIQAGGSLSRDILSPSKILMSFEMDLSLLNDLLPNKDFKGFVKMELQLSGMLSALETEAVIDLSGARFESTRFPVAVQDIQTHCAIEKNLLRVESFSARIADARFELSGKIPLDSLPLGLPAEFPVFEDREIKLLLAFANWDPFSLRELIPVQIFHQVKGRIGGRIELSGSSLRLEDISGRGFFETLELDFQGISFKQETVSRVSLENGSLSIDALSLRNGENRLGASGTARLLGEGDLSLSLDGALDNNLLHIFHKDGIFSGKTRFSLRVAQSYKSPEIKGSLKIQDGRYQRIFPRILLDQVNGEINFMANRVDIESLRGVLNGGETNLNGKIDLEGLAVRSAEIALKNENSIFDYPKGLSSQISGELKFLSDGNSHQLAGAITIRDARYRDDFRVGTAVFNLLRRGEVRQVLREPNPFLKNLNFDVNINIANNFIIDNNIAKAEVSADLKLIGTPISPSLSGRASIAEGGEIYFSQNTFFIEQGTVDFVNPTRIEPDLNLDARTKVKEYDIRLIVQGTPDKLAASLVSDPALSEPNVISLLVTGRTLDSASAQVLSVAGSTALSYLDNAITGRIEQATAKALGLESVRIDAGLISTDENPEARLTVGQHLSRDFELVFSQDLKDTRNQMWMANYNPYKSFNIQGVKRDNNEFNLALRHEIQFGLKSIPKPENRDGREKKNLVIGEIRLEGNPELPPGLIFQNLRLKKGKQTDFAGLQDGLERIRRLYKKNNYLSFSLAAKREERNGRLDVILQIDSGPQIFLEFEGAQIPKKMKKEIVDAWAGNPFGQLALEDIKERIREHFMKKRYYEVQVNAREKKGDAKERVLIFRTIKGRRFGKPDIHIEGNRALSDKVITTHLEKNRMTNSMFTKPREWVKGIEDLYIRGGYLRPTVQLPFIHLDRDGKNAHVEVSIDEGIRYEVGNLEIEGLHLFEKTQILDEIGIHPGDILLPERLYAVDQKIHELYVQKGFNDVRVQSDIQVHVDKGTVDLSVGIQENLRGMIAAISIEGNRLTTEKVILRELAFSVGDVLNLRKINETRKRLYDLGIFERVNINILPAERRSKNAAEEDMDPKNESKQHHVAINVVEFKPYRLRYGFQYDTESSFGVLANLVNRNVLGSANLLGASFHLNRDERDARAFFRSPYFFSKKISTEIFVSNNRTVKPAFTWNRTGFTIQQQMKIKKSSVISYNYTFEEIDTSYPAFEGIQNTGTIDRIGTLNAAFTRDTRDDILNATRGMFLSQNLRYAPGILGSNAHFIRYFGQFNTYQKISGFITYAASVRIGLGKGLNEDLPVSERFFAGGGTTIRGFKKDELGPKDPITGLLLGGDAVFILNQELRFPIFKKFGGVVFLDLGNVYPKITDFSFVDVRKTAGFGFRLHTPFVLVRFDWGFKLDRLPGETPSQIFFSIGQAF